MTLAVCAVAGLSGLVLATVLQDATGSASGKLGSLGNVSVAAGPTPEQALLPGQTSEGSVTVTNPNQQSQYVIRVDDATGDWMNADTGAPLPENLRQAMHVNAHNFATGIEVPQGTHDVLIPDASRSIRTLPWRPTKACPSGSGFNSGWLPRRPADTDSKLRGEEVAASN